MSISTDLAATPEHNESRTLVRRILTNQQFVLFIVLVALVIFFGSRNALFFHVGEFSNLFTDFSGLVLISLAETYVITAGGIDLAVGSTAAVSGVVAAGWIQPLVSHHVNQGLVLLAGTLACALIGAVAGGFSALLITAFDLVPFVATLVTYSVGAGLALVISHGAPVGYNPGAIYWSASGFGMITWLVAIVLVVAVLLGLVLHLTAYGRYNFAIGSNEFAARAAGINVRRHLVSVYVLAGVLAGLTGMFFYIRSGSGAATTGVTNSANLVAIAAVVIGGASLIGGVGRWAGTMLGAAILTVVSDGLIFINVPPTWIQVVVGALIAVAALLQTFRRRSRRLT
ncbi:MAG TPA: ABC transporter permease [Acidimicrobiales bacterium]|nr:ABC transporter permease [Acidimicrobiales bacterium]